MSNPTNPRPLSHPFGAPGQADLNADDQMRRSRFVPDLGSFDVPPGVMRPERESYFSSTWCLRTQQPVSFFAARLGEPGQGFEQLTPAETNWSGEGFPLKWCPRVEVFGLHELSLSERAIRRFAQGTWTCGSDTYPASAFIEEGALGWFDPDSLYHRVTGVDPRTWVLTCDVDPAEPLVVRLRVVSKVHE